MAKKTTKKAAPKKAAPKKTKVVKPKVVKETKKASRSPKNPEEMKALIMDKTWGDFGRGARGNVGVPMITQIWNLAQKAKS
jgi:hypothetical protein